MLGLKLKKRDESVSETEAGEITENGNLAEKTESSENNAENAVVVSGKETSVAKNPAELTAAQETDIGIKFASSDKDGETIKTLSEFSRLADILNTDEKSVLEECKLYQIRKIMSFVDKAVVRYGINNGEAKDIINNAILSGYGGVAISPAYLKTLSDNMRGAEEINVCAVVDFPFGESSFKVKLSEMKNAVKAGVDGIITVFPANLLKKESVKDLKKQLKKMRKTGNVLKGVAVNAEDTDNEDIKRFMRLAEKSGINNAAFLFGNVTEAQLTDKMREIIKNKNKISVKVMANVEDIAGVKTLIALGADGIITPFAEKIAKELLEEFKITSVKLS